MAFSAFSAVADWFSFASPRSTGSVSWSAGDEIVAVGITSFGSVAMATPTATGLTFSLVTSITTGGDVECLTYLWRATAGSSGSSTVSFSRAGTVGVFGGMVWVRPGSASAVVALAGTHTEANYSQAVLAGDDVIAALGDWNAVTPNKTPATGSGTATERVDTGDGSNYGIWAADWVSTAAGTFTFGPNNYTSLKVAQVGIVLRGAAGGPVEGTGVAAYGGAASATGLVVRLGTGTASYGGTAAAIGTPTRLGTGVGTYGYSVAGTGTIPSATITGSGTVAYGGAASATGTAVRLGTGVAAYGGTASATGTRSSHGTGTAAYGYTAAGTGGVVELGAGTAAYGYSATGTGTPVRLGTGVVAYGGVVAGSGQATRLGAGVVAYGYTVAGAGVIPTGAVLGTGVAAYGGTATATGLVVRLGTATAAYGYAITGTGTIPTDAVTGTGVATYGGVLTANGTAIRLGAGAVAYGGTPVAGGTLVRVGTATVSYDGQVAGSGLVVRLGTGVVAYGYAAVYLEPGAGWGWRVHVGGTLEDHSALLSDGSTLHPATATVT